MKCQCSYIRYMYNVHLYMHTPFVNTRQNLTSSYMCPSCVVVKYNFVGAIKTGCLKGPVSNSRFCALHKPRAVDTSHDDTTKSEENGTAVAQFITAKRVTRTGTHYQVRYMYICMYTYTCTLGEIVWCFYCHIARRLCGLRKNTAKVLGNQRPASLPPLSKNMNMDLSVKLLFNRLHMVGKRTTLCTCVMMISLHQNEKKNAR